MAQEQREHDRNPGGGTKDPGRQGEQGKERKTDQNNPEQGREERIPRQPQPTE
ncbi:MAG TPA: hypothetical protein VM778_01005 [Gemmatimonadota bacterium]|nr:hypothetical protein [Gemmatimonadota bacterium]